MNSPRIYGWKLKWSLPFDTVKSRSCYLILALSVMACFCGCATTSKPVAGPIDAKVKTHALAFSAITDSQNGYLHSTLEVTLIPDEAKVAQGRVRKMLHDSWSVQSREDLLALLARIQSGENGQRQRYWAIR